jgi:hypothetical protein
LVAGFVDQFVAAKVLHESGNRDPEVHLDRQQLSEGDRPREVLRHGNGRGEQFSSEVVCHLLGVR